MYCENMDYLNGLKSEIWLIISPKEVFRDIMVLESPCPPIDLDDVYTRNSRNVQPISFKFDTLWALEQLCSQPKDTLYHPNLLTAIYQWVMVWLL